MSETKTKILKVREMKACPEAGYVLEIGMLVQANQQAPSIFFLQPRIKSFNRIEILI